MKMLVGLNERIMSGDSTMALTYEEVDKMKLPAIGIMASNLQLGGGSARDATHQKPSDTNEQTSKPKGPAKRSGRWTLDEKILFLYGLMTVWQRTVEEDQHLLTR